MKKLLLFTILLALPLLASAYRCNVDGIYFNLIPDGNLAEVTYQSTNQWGTPQSDYSGDITIPEKFTHEGVEYSVKAIGYSAFRNCSDLTSVIIPNSVTSIGVFAFDGCKSLTLVTIPNSITSIGENAFSGCNSLTSFTIPNSMTSIGERAFSGCNSISSITVDSGNTKYDSRDNCNAIIETESNMLIAGCMNTIIPNSVTSIGGSAFGGCSGLTSITIPNSITSIGDYAFSGCSSLTSVNITDLEAWCKISCGILHASNPLVYAHHLYLNGEEVTDLVIPNSVTSIGSSAFAGCSGLTSVIIPNSVTSIGSNAFSNCFSLTSVTIPSSVTTIEIGVFWSCWGLSSVTIPNSVTSIGERAFSNCGSLTSVTIPNSVISIGNFAFNECINLTSVTIPNSVTTIGNNAFSSCSDLPSVIIPNSVTSIGSGAFIGCDKLKFVYCYAEKVPLTSESAYRPNNVLINATLYVPAASQNDYKNSRPWSYFLTILPLPDETGIDNTVNKKAKESARFTLDGIKDSGAKKGLNIIRMSDGTVKKVVVK